MFLITSNEWLKCSSSIWMPSKQFFLTRCMYENYFLACDESRAPLKLFKWKIFGWCHASLMPCYVWMTYPPLSLSLSFSHSMCTNVEMVCIINFPYSIEFCWRCYNGRLLCCDLGRVWERRRTQFPFNDVKSIIISILLRTYHMQSTHTHTSSAGILKRSHHNRQPEFDGVFLFAFWHHRSAWIAKCFSERHHSMQMSCEHTMKRFTAHRVNAACFSPLDVDDKNIKALHLANSWYSELVTMSIYVFERCLMPSSDSEFYFSWAAMHSSVTWTVRYSGHSNIPKPTVSITETYRYH